MCWTLTESLQLGLLIVTSFAVLVALFGEMIREWIKRPEIRLEFDKTSDRCFREATVLVDEIQDKNFYKNVVRGYYRLKVKNGGGLAKNVKIKIDVFDSEEQEVQMFEPSTLNWIRGKEKEDLARDEVNYFNVCSQIKPADYEIVSKVGPNVFATISRQLRIELFDKSQKGIFWDLPLDNYIFKIMVHGDNFKPIVKNFEFEKSKSETDFGELVEIN